MSFSRFYSRHSFVHTFLSPSPAEHRNVDLSAYYDTQGYCFFDKDKIASTEILKNSDLNNINKFDGTQGRSLNFLNRV